MTFAKWLTQLILGSGTFRFYFQCYFDIYMTLHRWKFSQGTQLTLGFFCRSVVFDRTLDLLLLLMT